MHNVAILALLSCWCEHLSEQHAIMIAETPSTRWQNRRQSGRYRMTIQASETFNSIQQCPAGTVAAATSAMQTAAALVATLRAKLASAVPPPCSCSPPTSRALAVPLAALHALEVRMAAQQPSHLTPPSQTARAATAAAPPTSTASAARSTRPPPPPHHLKKTGHAQLHHPRQVAPLAPRMSGCACRRLLPAAPADPDRRTASFQRSMDPSRRFRHATGRQRRRLCHRRSSRAAGDAQPAITRSRARRSAGWEA